MTLEEYETLTADQKKQIEDLTAERDGLKELSDENKQKIADQQKEIADLKKANYKLVNSLPAVDNKEKTVEQNLFDLFNRK